MKIETRGIGCWGIIEDKRVRQPNEYLKITCSDKRTAYFFNADKNRWTPPQLDLRMDFHLSPEIAMQLFGVQTWQKLLTIVSVNQLQQLFSARLDGYAFGAFGDGSRRQIIPVIQYGKNVEIVASSALLANSFGTRPRSITVNAVAAEVVTV
jgi:hypothetical protein